MNSKGKRRLPWVSFTRLVAPAGTFEYVTPKALRGFAVGDCFFCPLGASGTGAIVRVTRRAVDGVSEFEGMGLARFGKSLKNESPKEGTVVEVVVEARSPRFDAACSDLLRQTARELVASNSFNKNLQTKLTALASSENSIGQWLNLLAVLGSHFQRLENEQFAAVLVGDGSLVSWGEGILDRLAESHVPSRRRLAIASQSAPRSPKAWKDRVLTISTEDAAWVAFHPDDLKHRARDALDWWCDTMPELKKGLLLGATTASDGSFGIRFTQGPLSVRERRYVVKQAEMRLHVRRGRLFVGTPDHLPSTDSSLYEQELSDPEAWLDIAVGKYRARISSIDWEAEPGATTARGRATKKALTAYVVQFEPVQRLSEIAALDTLPELPPSN